MGDDLSVLDIAWLIYEYRLSLAGYPFERLHPMFTPAETSRHARVCQRSHAVSPFRRTVDTIRRTQAGKTLEMIADSNASNPDARRGSADADCQSRRGD
jgi:hypothetical protein